MHIAKNIWGDASVWETILLKQFQNRSEFEVERGKTRPFPSQIGSSIRAFKDTTYIY